MNEETVHSVEFDRDRCVACVASNPLTPATTTRGFGSAEMREVGRLLVEALVRRDEETRRRLADSLETAVRVASGLVTISVVGGKGETASEETLSTSYACPDCGTRFASRAEEEHTRCPRCRKSAALARSAFQTLFGART